AVEKWIDENMKYTRCVVVLIGSRTADRPWVAYEIEKAWRERRGLIGIHIHHLNCPRSRTCSKGRNPFLDWNVCGRALAEFVRCYDPDSFYGYSEIQSNLPSWVATAIEDAKRR